MRILVPEKCGMRGGPSLTRELWRAHLLCEVCKVYGGRLRLLWDTLGEVSGAGRGRGNSFDFLVIQGGLKFRLQLVSWDVCFAL